MAEINNTRLFPKKRIRPYRGRGDVYAWLRAHHRRVSELSATLVWADLVREMLHDGMQGRGGVTPTPKAVSKVWHRVCRDIEAETRAAPPPRSGVKPPSRISPSWRPQLVSPTERGGGAGTPPRLALPPPSQSHSTAVGVVGPRSAPIDIEAPFEFPTVDPDGNPIAAGRVFYQGRVMTRHAAEELERLTRALRAKDRGV